MIYKCIFSIKLSRNIKNKKKETRYYTQNELIHEDSSQNNPTKCIYHAILHLSNFITHKYIVNDTKRLMILSSNFNIYIHYLLP